MALRASGTRGIFAHPITRVCGLEHPDLVLAYLDPMSGSLILQALIAGVLGGIVTIKRAGLTVREALTWVWKRIKG